jgi:hypothetical protein
MTSGESTVDRQPTLSRCRQHRRLVCVAHLLIGLAAVAVPLTAAQGAADEFRLKAAFIYRFPHFVEWPPTTVSGQKTLDLCVLSPDPFHGALSELVEGETLNGIPLSVRQVDGGAGIEACHVLFVPKATPERRAILRRVSDHAVLTVGDSPTFLDEGGIVQLRVVDRRVRFDINAGAASRAGLRLSAQLLRLAVSVRGGPS